MGKKHLSLTGSEWQIIQAVWDGEPCTAPEVQRRLEAQTGWTYSTVRTFMDRMVEKGLLASEKVRHQTVYRSGVTRREAQRSELVYALKHAFNGALTPMVQCLLETRPLSTEELAELESILKARKQNKRS